MNVVQKLLIILGAAYIAIGGVVAFIFSCVGNTGLFIAIPLLFVVLGIGFVAGTLLHISKKKRILTHGNKYAAKIYGYVENTSYTVNGNFTVNTKVRYFDKNGVEKEAVLPTQFAKGSGMYPIGMTIDIYEYQGNYNFDPKSVRNEILPGESVLMDDKPVEPEKIKNVAVTCQNCGATFQAASGYSTSCPYCGSYHNI